MTVKAKWDEDAGEGASNCPSKKKNKQRREGSLVAAADRKGVRKPAEDTPDHFEKDHVRTMLSPTSIYTRTTVS